MGQILVWPLLQGERTREEIAAQARALRSRCKSRINSAALTGGDRDHHAADVG